MDTLNFKITGVEPLLLNNPRTVDVFDAYAVAKKAITGKNKKTEEDQLELRRLDVEAKLYFDAELGVFVPSRWLLASLAQNCWARIDVSKAKIRAAVFATETKIKLHFKGGDLVRTLADISGNPAFMHIKLLPQKGVRIAKAMPIFHDWSFESALEYDPSIVDRAGLVSLLDYSAKYGGFGDFRPTYGRSVFTELA